MSEFAWRAFYGGVVTPLMAVGMRVGALVDEKARDVSAGQRRAEADLTQQLRDLEEAAPDRATLPGLWLHATSVGEFEQAKPILRELWPTHRVAVTCFSPSVHAGMLRYPYKDMATYLPLDSRRNVTRFFDLIQPTALLFSKFDIWPNCVWEAHRRGVPCALIAGTMHATSKRLRPGLRGLLRHVHNRIALQCAVGEDDAQRLRQLCGPDAEVIVTGDTRFDQVFERAEGAPPLPDELPTWADFCVVAGSTYAPDEETLIPAFTALRERVPGARLVLVPHEPEPARLADAEKRMAGHGLRYARLSALDGTEDADDLDAVLIDRVGLLASLYTMGQVAFVGGSFNYRVHNVMEPAVHGLPVVFGPLMDNAPEAYGLMQAGGAKRVEDTTELADCLIQLAESSAVAETMGSAARAHVLGNLGASQRTLDALRRAVLPPGRLPDVEGRP
jgi:3-deoxy-D-manno-octulosonic-acid transferase